jgi:PmbA protein
MSADGTREGVLQALLERARAAGAEAADALLVSGASLSVERRMGATETLERAEAQDLSLRVFLGSRAAIVSASSIEPARFAELAERAVAMARIVPEDPVGGLAPFVAPAEDAGALDLVDPVEPDPATLLARADAAENAGRAVAGITNSEGAGAGWSRTEVWLASSTGFIGHRVGTSHSVSVSLIAGSGTGMQRDYEYQTVVHASDLEPPEALGRRAAERAVARLNPTRPRTGRVPVVYDPRVANSLVSHLAGAANGASVARGVTFLRERMGERLFAPGIAIHDDPRRVRGLRSRTFDAEGLPTARRSLVEDGVLRGWLLDTRSARQLGLHSTGNATRGTGSPPSPGATNLYLEAGAVTPAELMADIAEGLYVIELLGNALNPTTGDYSRGAAGFMIRDGALAEPVAEVTIAGNLLEMFAAMRPANDLAFRRGTDAPTVRVDGMVLAGA